MPSFAVGEASAFTRSLARFSANPLTSELLPKFGKIFAVDLVLVGISNTETQQVGRACPLQPSVQALTDAGTSCEGPRPTT